MKVTYLLTWVNEEETGRGDIGEQWLDCDYETACQLAKNVHKCKRRKSVCSYHSRK